jgi:hypothetical protein
MFPFFAEAESRGLFDFVGEQLIILFTIVGAVAALPALIEFWIDRRKRRERIALSLDDEPVSSLKTTAAGLDELLEGIDDLIDRAARPDAYKQLIVGNEILLIGPALSGKKTLARRIAQLAKLDRIVTVWNARSVDALSAAQQLVRKYKHQKIMLLLPKIDLVFDREDDELIWELDALIESVSQLPNVLIVGTASRFRADDPLDQTFGIKLLMPGTQFSRSTRVEPTEAQQNLLRNVAAHYWNRAAPLGFTLADLSGDQFIGRILAVASNPAEVEDIIVLCQTQAIHQKSLTSENQLRITSEMLERAIDRIGIHLLVGNLE